MALESYKQRKLRVEREQAPTVEEGLEDWQKYGEWHEPRWCGCGSCKEAERAEEQTSHDDFWQARRDEEKRQEMDSPRWGSVGEQVRVRGVHEFSGEAE